MCARVHLSVCVCVCVLKGSRLDRACVCAVYTFLQKHLVFIRLLKAEVRPLRAGRRVTWEEPADKCLAVSCVCVCVCVSVCA